MGAHTILMAAEDRKIERLSAAVFYAAVALLAYLVIRIVAPFFAPLAWAGVFAILFTPLHSRLEVRIGRSRAAWVTTIGVIVCLIVPGGVLGFFSVRESVQAAQTLHDVLSSGRFESASRLWATVTSRLGVGEPDLGAVLQEQARNLARYLSSELGNIIANVARVIVDVVIMAFALFFLLRDRAGILDGIRRVLPFEPPLRERMLSNIEELIHSSVSVSLLIAALQGSICGLAFALAGIQAPIFWTLVMGFLSLLPVVGAWPVWIPVMIWFFATGSFGKGILLLVLCGGIAGTLDNILRPALMSGHSGLRGISVFISVLGGIAAFGMIGVVLGPVVFATAAAVLDVYIRPAPDA
jgi:predicted PurR-regulated permease PerM